MARYFSDAHVEPRVLLEPIPRRPPMGSHFSQSLPHGAHWLPALGIQPHRLPSLSVAALQPAVYLRGALRVGEPQHSLMQHGDPVCVILCPLSSALPAPPRSKLHNESDRVTLQGSQHLT